MIITFIRHSKTTADPNIPITNWGLNEEGIAIAHKLSSIEYIKRLNVIYSSLQTKALETAIILAKPNGISIKTDNRLTEITSFTKQLFPDFETYAKDFFEDRVENWYGGETKKEALERFNSSLSDIVQSESSLGVKNIGIVTHGSILTLFSAQFSNMSQWEIHKRITMPDIAFFDWEKQKFVTIEEESGWLY